MWWKRMVTVAVIVCFVTLLRGAGLRTVPRRGLTWLIGNKERTDPKHVPREHTGALMLVTSRKSRQHSHSWVPIRRGRATELLASHVSWLNSLPNRPRFLFPARRRKRKHARLSWHPHPKKSISSTSLLRLIRRALREACGLSMNQSCSYSTHSLRVGGINFYRAIGVPLELRAQLADHMTLPSSLRYLRMAPSDQMSVLAKIASRE